jgi:hypothetical protein
MRRYLDFERGDGTLSEQLPINRELISDEVRLLHGGPWV